jgi:hypothetical protein
MKKPPPRPGVPLGATECVDRPELDESQKEDDEHAHGPDFPQTAAARDPELDEVDGEE